MLVAINSKTAQQLSVPCGGHYGPEFSAKRSAVRWATVFLGLDRIGATVFGGQWGQAKETWAQVTHNKWRCHWL